MNPKTNPFESSLVKYNTPQLIGVIKRKSTKKAGRGKLPPLGKTQATQTEDILNSILPPRSWDDGEHKWLQFVSSTPATRMDVINLQEQLDKLLLQRKAKETGVCPVREELYSQCFDELIRQVTIKCAERGLLLIRVRDEMKMTQKAYETLYESSVAFGMRKALQAEQGKNELKERVEELEKENLNYQNKVKELELQLEALEKRKNEKLKQEEKKHNAEVDFYKKQNQQYRSELERIMSIQSTKK